MIKVSIYKNASNLINGFKVMGHANYDEYGRDIICSAVSVLVINTINSIEQLTKDKFSFKQDENSGLIEFRLINSKFSKETSLLLNSLILGLTNIEDEYTSKYVKLSYITN